MGDYLTVDSNSPRVSASCQRVSAFESGPGWQAPSPVCGRGQHFLCPAQGGHGPPRCRCIPRPAGLWGACPPSRSLRHWTPEVLKGQAHQPHPCTGNRLVSPGLRATGNLGAELEHSRGEQVPPSTSPRRETWPVTWACTGSSHGRGGGWWAEARGSRGALLVPALPWACSRWVLRAPRAPPTARTCAGQPPRRAPLPHFPATRPQAPRGSSRVAARAHRNASSARVSLRGGPGTSMSEAGPSASSKSLGLAAVASAVAQTRGTFRQEATASSGLGAPSTPPPVCPPGRRCRPVCPRQRQVLGPGRLLSPAATARRAGFSGTSPRGPCQRSSSTPRLTEPGAGAGPGLWGGPLDASPVPAGPHAPQPPPGGPGFPSRGRWRPSSGVSTPEPAGASRDTCVAASTPQRQCFGRSF